MMRSLIFKLESISIMTCEWIIHRKFYSFWFPLILPFVVLFFSFPSFERIDGEFSPGWNAILTQAKNPFDHANYDPISHQAKLSFRLTIPLIAHVFHLGIDGILAVQCVFGLGLFLMALALFEKFTNDKVSSILLTLSLAFIYAGRISFTEIRGVFDGPALFFLVLSIFKNNPISIFIGVFLAAWTDERALIASSMVFLFWAYHNHTNSRGLISSNIVAVLLAWAAYFSIRFYLIRNLGFSVATEGTGLNYLIQQTNNLPTGVWSALEGNWVLILSAILILFRYRQPWFALTFISGILLIIVVAMCVFDITRSMAFVLPAMFMAVFLIGKYEQTKEIREISFWAMFFSFIFPAYSFSGDYYIIWNYPLPLQLLRYLVNG